MKCTFSIELSVRPIPNFWYEQGDRDLRPAAVAPFRRRPAKIHSFKELAKNLDQTTDPEAYSLKLFAIPAPCAS